MSPTEIPFSFPFWNTVMIMSTTDDSSSHSEIIKVLNAQTKNLKLSEIDVVYFIWSGDFGNSSELNQLAIN